MRSGKIIFHALECIAVIGLNLLELPLIFGAPYGSSGKQIRRYVAAAQRQKDIDDEAKRLARNVLYRLRQDGLIDEKESGIIRLTRRGVAALQKLRKSSAALPAKEYEAVAEAALKIVIFDVPECYRYKRDWLRAALRNMGFRMLQRSVWAGNVQIPEAFVEDLRKIALLQYVEIFAVTRSGSLRKVA